MKLSEHTYFNLGRRLTLILALLIAVIVGGNGLVILQFQRAQLQSDRLTGVNQQLIAVLRLHESLLSFHHQLDELVQSKDAQRLVSEAEQLRTALLQETNRTRTTLAYLGPKLQPDAAFLTAVDTIETTLPLQLQDLINLARADDWEVVRLHLDHELGRIEDTTSAEVKSVNRALDEELPIAIANMRDASRRILLIVPATAISTVLIAALFGWSIARRMLELRLEERVNERTRIARELHDTLLQDFQATLMNFGALRYLIPERPDVQQMLDSAIEQVRAAIRQGRDAVQGLRSSSVEAEDFGEALRALGEQLASDSAHARSVGLTLNIEGTPRALQPLARDEIYRIASEALRNAYRHSVAGRIEVQLNYGTSTFELRVRDDGKGISQEFLREKGYPGHFGLAGMRERAEGIGGKLSVWSAPGSGTELHLSLAGEIAYDTLQLGHRWLRKRSRTQQGS